MKQKIRDLMKWIRLHCMNFGTEVHVTNDGDGMKLYSAAETPCHPGKPEHYLLNRSAST